MANVTEVKNKDGQIISYRIRVLNFTDENGKKHFYTQNWKVPESYKTQKSIERALQKAIGAFEAACKRGEVSTSSQTFLEYAIYYIDLCKRDHKAATISNYERLLPFIKDDIGHVKLSQLRPEQLNRLYMKLQSTDVKKDAKASIKGDTLKQLRKDKGMLLKDICTECGISEGTARNAFNGKNISLESAQKLAAFFDKPMNNLFEIKTSSVGLSPKYILNIHSFISAVLQNALREGLVARNVASLAQPPRLQKREAEHFEIDEILQIKEALEAEPIKYRIATLLLISTGIRRGELCGIRWPSIDLNNATIRIENNLQYLCGQGLVQSTPKSGKARTVSISRELIPILKEYKQYQRMQARLYCSGNDLRAAKWNPDQYLLTKENGEPLTPNAINEWMLGFSKKTGLHINPHKFRHSQATVLIGAGVDIVTVSKRLGHAQTSTTMNIYAHALEKADRNAADKIGEILFKEA